MENFPWRKAAMVLAVLFISIMIFESFKAGNETVARSSTVPYSVFKAQVRSGNVTKVVLTPVTVTAELVTPLPSPTSTTPVKVVKAELPTIQDPELMPLLEAKGVEVTADREEGSNTFWIFVANALPFLLLIGFWVWTSRRAQARQMGPFGNFGQVKAKMFDESMPKTTFNDVAGMKAQKYELEEVVDFLKRPEKYEKIGGKIPTGILLMGPPGTGKTLLAKAVAGESGVPFFSTSASEFIEMFVGVGASRVRDLFKRAREAAPSIIFIDEIDAVGRSRGTGLGGGHDEREQTLNQLLGEMDGFEGHERVIVIAATNRPDVLDSALLRPGRFDRQVMVDLPTLDDRTEILKVHTRKLPLAPDVDLSIISRGCPGMSGADLENLCNEAALFAARYNHPTVNAHHFELAKDKLLMGLERPGLTTETETRITAFHEAGHTLVAKLIPGMDPVHKVTVLPRGPALGVTQLIPTEDRHYYPKTFLMGKLAVSLGGRAAEQLMFGDTSTGAQSDLKYTTNLAEKMVCQWGMSDRVGPVTFTRGEEHVFLGKKIAQDKLYSESMGWIIDQEIEAIVRGAERHALELLEKNQDKLEKIALMLIEREELLGEEVDKVLAGEELGPRREKDVRLPDAEPPAPAESVEGQRPVIAEA